MVCLRILFIIGKIILINNAFKILKNYKPITHKGSKESPIYVISL